MVLTCHLGASVRDFDVELRLKGKRQIIGQVVSELDGDVLEPETLEMFLFLFLF